jgi:hypothetical protein
MEAVTAWILGILMLALPADWSQTATTCAEVAVIDGPPGEMTQECSATWTKGAAELTVIVWSPVVARDGGPMESVEDEKGKLLGKDVLVSRTKTFMGTEQEVLVTSLELTEPKAQILVYAKGTTPEEFQALLDQISLNE